MADERIRTISELKRLFTGLINKPITDEMMSIAFDSLRSTKTNLRTAGFFHAGSFDSQISFDSLTRIFTIKPFDPLVVNFIPRFLFYSMSTEAILRRVFYSHEIEIPDEEGLYCIYFDTEPSPGRNQVLTIVKNPTAQQLEKLYFSKVIISFIYWDFENQSSLYFGDDRHGSEWNPQIHWYLHNAFNARRKTGLQITDTVINGDGSNNNHAQFIVSAGAILHDDFELAIAASTTSIPVLYSLGTLPRFIENAGFSFAGSARVFYNSGQTSLAQADSGNYVLYHIFATNEIENSSRKIVSVMGTAQYTTLADAYQRVAPELDGIVTYIPQQGRCYLGSIIVQTSNDYTNDVKARIVALTGNKTHPPVTIAEGSKPYLYINEKQELAIDVDALPGGNDEKVKYDAADTAAGYLADKIISGTGINISEGTGADENKIKVSATADTAIKIAIDFIDASELVFVYNCPVTLKFTSQESEGANAAISPALNTDMTQYGKVTITAAEVGLIVLNGITL